MTRPWWNEDTGALLTRVSRLEAKLAEAEKALEAVLSEYDRPRGFRTTELAASMKAARHVLNSIREDRPYRYGEDA